MMKRFAAIRDEMLRRINDGDWPVGHELPTEPQLAAEFGVARGTVRRAMDALSEQGLIERRKRAGTRVAARQAHASRMSIPIVRHGIEARGDKYGYRLLDRRITGADAEFGGPAGMLHVECLHLANEKPFQLEERQISLDTLPESADTDFSRQSPNEWLVSLIPATDVETTLRADGASAHVAACLDLPEGAPIFVLERRTFLNGAALTQVRMSHPAAMFSITTRS